MSLFNHFQNINLTAGQQYALSKLENFLISETKIFLLKGFAGTGKTTLLKGIVNYLKSQNKFAHLMAPTGRAAKVLKDKTGVAATTIHKGIYNFNQLKRINQQSELEKKTFKFYFDLHKNEYSPEQVFVIDEASMISNQYSDDEFFRFGSGYLLNDLLKYVDLHTTKNHKIIFVGDPAQLPPVNDPSSRALEIEYFSERELHTTEVEMKEVVRQKGDSGILKNASLFRDRIENPETHTESFIDFSLPDVRQFQLPEFRRLFFDECSLPIHSKIVITYSNALAFQYNKIIRDVLFPVKTTVQSNDTLLVIKNNYGIEEELLNGELIEVIDVTENVEIQVAPVVIDGKKKKVSLSFRDVQVKKWNSDIILFVKVIDSLLNSKHPRLSSYEQKALYINFIMRHPNLKEGTEEFSMALKNDPYFNALQVKYGYAMTCHKAQGGEWEKAFVDFNGRVGLKEAHFRWSYTAITRAVKELMVVNQPNFRAINQIQYSSISPLGKLPANAIKYGYIQDTPFHDQSTPSCQRAKYFAIDENLLETKYSVKNVIPRSAFHETYMIEYIDEANEEQIITFELYSNSSGVYSSYRSNNDSSDAKEVISLLKKSIPNEYDDTLISEIPYLQSLHSKILDALDSFDLKICGIDETRLENYFVSYFFESDGIYRMIQFYFKKNGHFSRAIVKSIEGANDTDFQEFIEKLKH